MVLRRQGGEVTVGAGSAKMNVSRCFGRTAINCAKRMECVRLAGAVYGRSALLHSIASASRTHCIRFASSRVGISPLLQRSPHPVDVIMVLQGLQKFAGLGALLVAEL